MDVVIGIPDLSDTRVVMRTVRIFLSSTFTDTRLDRNALMEQVFEPLTHLCQEHGLAFEVVDLRWGVRQESVEDHCIVNICMDEIKRCQDISLNVAFIAILGDKYGWRPLPPSIHHHEFELLASLMGQSERELLSTWYVRDFNAVPSCYQLQAISSKFPVHSKKKEEVSKAWQDWGQVENEMWKSLSSAADKASLKEEEKAKYYESVTHMEVERGVLRDPEAHVRCFVVDRRFDEINVQHEAAADYVNLQNGEPDKRCKELMEELKCHLIPSCLGESSRMKFNLQWHSQGITPAVHSSYINELCTKVRDLLQSQIEKVIQALGKSDPLKEEIIRHTIFCRERTHAFEGRADVLRAIFEYTKEPDTGSLCVVFGESGVGKTTVIAKAARELQERHSGWVVLFRFCGITPTCSTGRELTQSLCEQIKQIYDIQDDVPQDYSELCDAFPKLLAHATREKPLYILIDSLDQLTDEDGARRFLEWLPRHVPPNVRLIVSTLPDVGGCLLRLKTFGIPEDNFIQVRRMSPRDGKVILDKMLRAAGRTLTPQQKTVILEAFNRCSLPLYLQLLFSECKAWPSYKSMADIDLPPDVTGMINMLYEGLERYHGAALVARVLGLLAARPDGMNRFDILHMLSCDDQLLADVLEWHQPPKRRLPPLLLARLQHDLGPFLVERGAFGVSLMALYHRQFWEVAQTRYLSGDNYKYIYSAIASYFSGAYHVLFGGSRDIPAQPIAYSHEALNLRKLDILPRALIEARDYANVCRHLGDLEFIQAKCMAGMGYDLVAECMLAVQYAKNDQVAKEVQQALDDILAFVRTEVHILSKHPLLTYQQAAMYPETSCIGRAARKMRTIMDHSEPSAIPRPDGWVEWINKPNVSEAFQMELSGHSKGVLTTCFSVDDRKIFSGSEDCTIRVWDSKTGALLAQLDGHAGAVTCVRVSPDGGVIASSSADKTIRLWNPSDEFLRSLEGHEDCVTSLAFSKNGKRLVSVALDKKLKVWDVESGNLLDTLTGHDGYPVCCAWNPVDNTMVATCGDNLELLIWDLETKSSTQLKSHGIDEAMVNFPDKKKLSGHERLRYDSLVWSVDFSPDGMLLASTGADSNVIIWDISTGERRYTFNIPNDGSSVRFISTSQGTHLAAASGPHMTITLIDVGAEPQIIALLGGHSDWVMDVAFSSDGALLTSGSRDRTVRVWDCAASEKLKKARFHSERCWSVAYSDDGMWLASASDDFKVCVWNMATQQHVLVYEGHEKKRKFSCGVRACTFSHDASLVASGGDELKIRVWSRETGVDQHVLSCGDKLLPWCIRFSPNDKRIIAVGEYSCGVLMWDLETECVLAALGGHVMFCQYTEFSPSGEFIISSSIDNTAQVWRFDTHRHVTTLQHPDWATCAVFSHDERHIATCSRDQKVRLWAVEGYAQVAAMEGHESEIRVVSFSPDDSLLASAALDQTIRVWDLSSYTQHHVFYTASGVWALTWHPISDDLLAAGDAVGYLYFIRLHKRGHDAGKMLTRAY
ncbi:NACHT domain- and WD repeat-containing protein 1 isoform X2 [Nematostella vectensis]|uniref:NACHT domain- and WD repeat-containing protein 1 isoform X2 n=1 Tax=Nematostella vectensis TaxID=45351 RepID=UPI002076FC03|nr:NACHT domain- and WD repeat-containing protein 1 isoform X2 [Nematostella vectensis]